MNKTISNMWRMLSVVCLAALTLTACEKDDESNPTLHKNTTGFTINTPALAANNTYDLLSAARDDNGGLTITIQQQPDYDGVPYVVNYHTQVALVETFADFIELETPSTKAAIKLDAAELNQAVIDLYLNAHPDEAFPNTAMPLYLRVRAELVNVANTVLDEVMSSNYITLPSVLATDAPKELTLPTQLFIVGSSIGDGDAKGYWSWWKPVAGVYGMAGEFYTMCYFPAGAEFKWGEAEQDWRGFEQIDVINDEAGAGLEGQDGGNIKVGNAGWYAIHVVTEIGVNAVKYTWNFYPGAAYVIGAVEGGNWTDSDADWKMAPGADGVWESPAFAASGELRAYIKIPGTDWWRTEFTIVGGNLLWRDADHNCNANWKDDVGEEYSVNCSTGQKLYVDFNTNTGEVR